MNERNELAQAKNKDYGLPELKGTPKQVAWAESIRYKWFCEINKNQGHKNYKFAHDILSGWVNASDWIDARNESPNRYFKRMANFENRILKRFGK